MQPLFLTTQEKDELCATNATIQVHDQIGFALDELFDIAHPAKKDTKSEAEVAEYGQTVTGGNPSEWGTWVHYPWLNQVVHLPPQTELRALRTSRNRNLITSEEQAKLYQSTILIIGMSVGSNIVEALVSQGIGSTLVLVDMDIIEPSNLNRIRSPYHHVGLHKVDAISRKVWEIDPYIQIKPYYDGLNEETLQTILDTESIDIIVDEMDELRMKVLLREAAQRLKLPVVMAADDGDNSLLDIDRFDTDPQAQPFNGVIPQDILERVKTETIPRAELGMLIGRYFIGAENIPLRMYQSLSQVGKTLPSWPQLGGAAALSGIVVAYAVKKIVLGQAVRGGRTLISLDEKLDQEEYDSEHHEQLATFQNFMNKM